MQNATTFSLRGGSDALPRSAMTPRARAVVYRFAIAASFFIYAALLGTAWWLVLKFVPDHAAFRLLGHSFDLKNLHSKILGNAGLVLLVLPAVLWLECLVVGWQRCSCRKLLFAPTPTVKTDIACFLLDQFHMMGMLSRVMMLGLSLISGLLLRDWLSAHLGLAIDPSALPLPLQVVIYFYAYSFFDYWTHRLGHARLFWPLHRYHHSAEEFDVINAERIHPAGFAQIFLITMPMAALGATPEALIYVNVLTIALGYVIHSQIDSDFGWIGRYIIQSPLHHRAHHKLDMTAPPGHFSMTPVWDHLFGTWGGPAEKRMAIGVDTSYRHGLWVMPDLLRDYWDFWKGLVGRRQLAPSEH